MFIKLFSFLLALILGIWAVGPGKFFNVSRYASAHWSEETLARPLFTLEEGRQLLGRKVRLNNSKFHPNNKGRVGFLEMVAPDKFFIMIDWDVDPNKGKETLLLYDKDVLPDLEFEN